MIQQSQERSGRDALDTLQHVYEKAREAELGDDFDKRCLYAYLIGYVGAALNLNNKLTGGTPSPDLPLTENSGLAKEKENQHEE